MQSSNAHVITDRRAVISELMTNKDALIRERCRRSFFHFVREFWEVVTNDEPVWNWHIPYLCGELMLLYKGVEEKKPKPYDLLITIPPGTTKSIVCSVMYPVWCWVHSYWMRFISASYSATLSLEHAEMSRDIVRSIKFARLFPEIVTKRDRDAKSNFRIEYREFGVTGEITQTKLGGGRLASSVGGTLTGLHAHILIVDDPLNPQEALSDKEVKTANYWMDNTLSTRKVDKAVTPTILIMQRLRADDPAGKWLEKKKNQGKAVKHICLPGEESNKVRPRALKKYYSNGLLDPVRLSRTTLKGMKVDLGQYGYSSQVLQDPTPPEGGMIKVDKITVLPKDTPLINLIKAVRYWDKAATEGDGAYTVGVLMYLMKGRRYIVADVVRGQWGSARREQVIKRTAIKDGPNVLVYFEQEPGSGGKDSVLASIDNLADIATAKADRPTGDKIYRADPFSVAVDEGWVSIIDGRWNTAYLDELRQFPNGPYKDQVDATSGAYKYLRKVKTTRRW